MSFTVLHALIGTPLTWSSVCKRLSLPLNMIQPVLIFPTCLGMEVYTLISVD
jgi:hypothetical protein